MNKLRIRRNILGFMIAGTLLLIGLMIVPVAIVNAQTESSPPPDKQPDEH